MVRGEALRAYRDLLRVTRKSFFGDTVMLGKCAKQIRNRFNKNRHVNSDTEIQELIRHARIASKVIATKFVQAEVNESGAPNTVMLRESAKEIRKRFMKNHNVNSEAEIQKILKLERKDSRFMSAKIVQAELNESGGPEVKPGKAIMVDAEVKSGIESMLEQQLRSLLKLNN